MDTKSRELEDESFDQSGLIPDFVFVGEDDKGLRDVVLEFMRTRERLEKRHLRIRRELQVNIENSLETECPNLSEVTEATEETVALLNAFMVSDTDRFRLQDAWLVENLGKTETKLRHSENIISGVLDWVALCADLMKAQKSLVDFIASRSPEQALRIASDLLLVKGFFSSVLWMVFSEGLPLKDDIAPQYCSQKASVVGSDFQPLFDKAADMVSARAPQSVCFFQIFSEVVQSLGQNLLRMLLFNSRVSYMLSKSAGFHRGVRGILWAHATKLKDRARLKEKIQALDRTLVTLEVMKPHRQMVEAINECWRVSEGVSGREGGAFDFPTFFRAFYWHVLEGGNGPVKRPEAEGQPQHRFRMCVWGEWVRRIKVLGMAEDVRRGKLLAFASAEASADARSLYEDALGERAGEGGSIDELRGLRLHFLYRVKGLEMSIQNRKVSKRVEKEKGKVVKVLRQMESEWEKAIGTEEKLTAENEVNSPDFEMEETVARNFLALLILSLESPSPKLSALSSSNRSQIQTSLLEWFESRRADSSRRAGRNSSPPDSVHPFGTHMPLSPFTPLTALPLSSLSSFLEDHVLCVSENPHGFSVEYTGCDSHHHQESVPSPSSSSLPLSSVSASSIDTACSHPDEEGAPERKDPERKKRTYRFLKSCQEAKADAPFACGNCSHKRLQAKHCMACKLAVYCCRKCQKAHWTKRGDDSMSRTEVQEGVGERQSAENLPANSFALEETPVGGDTCAESPLLCPSAHKRRCSLLQENVLRVLLSDSYTSMVEEGDSGESLTGELPAPCHCQSSMTPHDSGTKENGDPFSAAAACVSTTATAAPSEA
uniref:MYND-type domain-containing protein n=1 Tax=Chromera velia CCMP2878 TaxID=1169474 RepID=A0A0G4FXD7_9ALVE|eukprot:Cvel_19108.t1-p1 / transcript=Cvel_19108.t1 / gene=Cvel_19108 / organism=Chromera_velia_CCMP2878 / gene_product=hypothetical protein / transcript_product=hypothetical protein / location=Cvel_scaffold1622:39353-41839(+) / protein_length=829 / sequence_SO=supercontig / SO=protein_coding / is_pseudo=false